MAEHLLPLSSTVFERALSLAASRILNVPVPINTLWNPQTCPAPLLPWLAWAMSVDVWDNTWPEQTKRDVIAASPAIHRVKGTRGAVERAVAAVWDGAELEEWFEYGGDPYKFRVRAEITTRGFSEADWDLIVTVVLAAKNVRSHLDTVSLRLNLPSRTPMFGAATTTLSAIEVLPRLPEDLSQQVAVPRFAAAQTATHTIEVNPQVS